MKSRWEAAEEGIGEMVCRNVEDGINRSGANAKTIAMLVSCVPSLKPLVEGICPMVLGGSVGKFSSFYGPSCKSDARLVAYLTPEKGIMGDVSEWPAVDLVPLPDDFHPRAWWLAIWDAVGKDDGQAACIAFAQRTGAEGLAMIEAKRKEVIANGYVPLIVVMSVVKDMQACGGTVVAELPPSIEKQMMEAEYADNI